MATMANDRVSPAGSDICLVSPLQMALTSTMLRKMMPGKWWNFYSQWFLASKESLYSKICVKRPLSKRPENLVFKDDYHLMQVESIAECSIGSILQYF